MSKFEGKRIYLRHLRKSDATNKYASWINDPEVNKFLSTKSTTVEALREYIKNRIKELNCLFMGIFLKDTNKHIGNIKLNFTGKGTSILGIIIGEKSNWNKGYGSEAIEILTSLIFYHFETFEIHLGVNKKNYGAIKLYLKNGFKIDNETENGYHMIKFK